MTSPTTPRDAIGLSERLRDDIAQLVTAKKHAEFAGAETGVRVKDPSLLLTDLTEAAAALDALQGEISQWANEVARYKAYAEKFEQENAALQARVQELEAATATQDQMIKNQARRLQQERDEALERLKPFASDFDLNDCDDRKDDDAMEVSIKDLRGASDCVRRLAVGRPDTNPDEG